MGGVVTALTIAVCFWSYSVAWAEAPDVRIVVLESYVAERPDRQNFLLSELLDDLEALGLAAHPGTIIPIIGTDVPRPGLVDKGASPTGLTRGELVDEVEVGYQAWATADFDEAKRVLVHALSRIRRNPALLVTDVSNLSVIYKAQLALSLSLAKLGETAQSEAFMQELIRMFPTTSPAKDEFGPEAVELHRSVARNMRKLGRGRLVVNAGNDHAIIFIDSQLRGAGKVELGDLLPGVHHVFLQVVGTIGRQYDVEVVPNQISSVSARWDTDMAVWVTDAWVGVVFPTEAEQQREGAFVSALARRWRGDEVVVVSPKRIHGSPALAAARYDSTGAVVRSARVVIDRDREAKLRALARFVADGTNDERLDDVRSRQSKLARRSAEVARPTRWLPGALGAGGLAAIAAGIVVFKSAGPNFHAQLEVSEPRWIGLALTQVGGVSVGASVYLFCRRSRVRPWAAGLLGVGAAGLASGLGAYIVDEDLDPNAPHYTDTTPYAVPVGAAGAALVGVGLWLWLRKDGSAAAPTMSLHGNGAVLGWSGSF
jgi:hypothetical protein